MGNSYGSAVTSFLCLWSSLIGFFSNCQSQHTHSVKMVVSTAAYECNGVESFEKVSGVELSTSGRIPLFASSTGAITADCYNRCRSSIGCSGFWIDYNSSECFRLTQPKVVDKKTDIDFTRAAAYFERVCLFGDICSKAWAAERIPGYELIGYDDIIIKSVISRKRCIELCLSEKRLPCRSAEYWESRKECRLSREDRRSQPTAFAKSTTEVDYIENACNEPVQAERGKECEWEVMHGAEFKVVDFTTRSSSMHDCQRTCETYVAFVCRSITFHSATGTCLLSGSDTATTSNKLLRKRDEKIYAQRVPCVDMSLECQGESMTAKLKSHSPFYGKMFTLPMTTTTTSSSCEVFGSGKLHTTITLPLYSCGIQKQTDGSFATTLLIQQHALIQKRSDSAFQLVCSFPEGNQTLSKTISYGTEMPRLLGSDISASASGAFLSPGMGIGSSIVINSTAKPPSVTLRILDSNGDDVTGVSLGDQLFLVIGVEQSSAYGVLVRDLIAKSGTKDEELVLLDPRGCPEDPSIFPYMTKEPNSKSLKSRFEAFKFTNDVVVRFEVHLQFCRHECPPVKCDGEVSYGRKRRDGSLNSAKEKTEDLIELKRDIIVNSQRTPGRRFDQGMENSSGHAINVGKANNLDTPRFRVCISKQLLLGVIVILAVIQVVVIVPILVCLCHKPKHEVINDNFINTNILNNRQSSSNRTGLRSSPLDFTPRRHIRH